jgi:hypothetical protein
MKTRIAIYHNPNGKLFYRPQWKLPFLPVWWRFTGTDCYSWWIEEFESQEAAQEFINRYQRKLEEQKQLRRYFIRAEDKP